MEAKTVGLGFTLAKTGLGKGPSFLPSPEKENSDRTIQEPETPAQEKRHFLRATIESAGIYLYHAIRYWSLYSTFIEDWQFHLTWEDQKKRLFLWEFDSNPFKPNWTHAFAGVVYYNAARTNNLSFLESVLFGVAESMCWEYIAEWREVVSINDQIFSIFGAISCGEPWYQLGKYFNETPGIVNYLIGFLNPYFKLHQLLDGKKARRLPSKTASVSPAMDLFLGLRSLRSGQTSWGSEIFTWRYQGEIITLPEYGRPGETSLAVGKTMSSLMNVDMTLTDKGSEEVSYYSRAVLFGYYEKNVTSERRGHEFYLGLGTAFTLFRKKPVAWYDYSTAIKVKRTDIHLEEPRNFTDKFAVIHTLGPVFDYVSLSPNIRWRLVLEAYPDFGLINSYALNEYSIGRDISGIKTTMMYYGYYFGFGGTFSADGSVDFHRFYARGRVRYQLYGSIDGADRFQDELKDDFHVKDSRLQYSLSLGYRLGRTPLRIEGTLEKIDRRGKIKNIDHRQSETRLFVGLNFIL